MDVSNEMPPDLNTTLDNLKKEIFSTLNCCQIGKIKSVDTSAGTVQVNLQIKRAAQDGTSTAIPVLTDCPYFVLQGGGAYIDMPIAAGDYCIVLFNDRDIDNWWKSGNQADPATNRKHHLSDGIALVGIMPKTSVLASEGNSLGIIGGSHKIRINNDSAKLAKIMSDLFDNIATLLDDVNSLTTYGSPAAHSVTAASKAVFTSLKTTFSTAKAQMQTLLEE